MFQTLSALPDDPILGLMAAYRMDSSPEKVDLGVGVYKDDRGRTVVLEAVRAAERWLLSEQESKAYLGPAGNEQFNEAIAALVLGADHAALREGRVRAVQAPGGCGALRVGATLVNQAAVSASVHVSDPTWANHSPLLAGAGLRCQQYCYYDAFSGAVRFDAMLAGLAAIPPGDVVLLHGACHNPTGADLSKDQWRDLGQLMCERGLIPFIDLAYQGLGNGLDEDAQGVRLLVEVVPEALIAVSCSKSFGLYRERVGALIIVGESRKYAQVAAGNVFRIARGLYSMPPDHGAAVVARVLDDPKLGTLWRRELAGMRARITSLRCALAEALAYACPERDFAHISRQRGLFSLIDLPHSAVDRLRKEKHIYMTRDGRINIAGLRPESVDYVAWSMASELKSSGHRRAARESST